MIKTLFIANRGEIAVRIIRTAQRLGIRTVLGVSEADRHSLGAQLADEAIVIGPGPSRSSYLDIPVVVAAAKLSKADALHPGYGFLSENSTFARALAAEGITFVGPTPDSLDAMGDRHCPCGTDRISVAHQGRIRRWRARDEAREWPGGIGISSAAGHGRS